MTTTPDPTDPRHSGADDTVRHEAAGEDLAGYEATGQEPIRPTGPSWPTIALGVLALVVAGMALTYQLVDLSVDWTLAAPVAIVSAGALLVLLGLVGLLGGRGEEEPR